MNQSVQRPSSLAPHTPFGTNHDFFSPRLTDTARQRTADPKVKHDIKNQLGIVLGFTELLLADMPDDDPRKADLMEIRAATMMTMELINPL